MTTLATSPHAARTLGYEEAPPPAAQDLEPHALAMAATQVAPTAPTSEAAAAAASFAPPPAAARTTVLPRVDSENGSGTVQLVLDTKSRYEPVKLLGTGGMGEVILVRDHDIARPVAQKRLLPNITDPALLARFVDEIRTVGRLEHPNIVPIHDVGVDELGRYFFVMKYVEGETLESIIEKLAAGDAEAHRKYTIEQRIALFFGVLHALEYAHENSIVHRDIKPANVMVGRYGEVVLMDWGIAKPIGAARDPAATVEGEIEDRGGGERGRMFATRVGSVIGTPAYMSPEQARGENDRIDARSDLYSAAVMFHELISLCHYLADKTTLEALIAGVIGEEMTFFKLLALGSGGQPAELIHFVQKGLSKDPALRFQSAGEMIGALQANLEGKVKIQCHITMTKRVTRELGRFVDRHPHLAFFGFLGFVATLVFAVVMFARLLIH